MFRLRKAKRVECRIEVPDILIVATLKRFGPPEALAMLVCAAVAFALEFFTRNAWVIAISGAILEKLIVFFYQKDRKTGLLNTIESGLQDLLYIWFLNKQMAAQPTADAWILSVACYFFAIVAVVGADLAIQYLLLSISITRYKLKGFLREHYYEARMDIDSRKDPEEVLQRMAEVFGLKVEQKALEYRDLYFAHKIWGLCGRRVALRLRQRDDYDSDKKMQSVQIAFTRAGEYRSEIDEQYRFFPVQKWKLIFVLADQEEMPSRMSEIANKKVAKILSKKVRKDLPICVAKFERREARGGDIMVAVDGVKFDMDTYRLEIKCFSDKLPRLIEAIRLAIEEFPVKQTTRRKIDRLMAQAAATEVVA